ncbi:N-acylneuraminate cytidylyltransferase B [Anabarilius grahami]|uniref:N-acylneuraminate cytidylyltransferase B n=1 Tax=Anabarilius grahami TaxID=495550 RepID=A0A3N0Z8S9_ANAGA|nr:N-acylneuraminate cytidylyltransferase B [Anabarilius grahami]
MAVQLHCAIEKGFSSGKKETFPHTQYSFRISGNRGYVSNRVRFYRSLAHNVNDIMSLADFVGSPSNVKFRRMSQKITGVSPIRRMKKEEKRENCNIEQFQTIYKLFISEALQMITEQGCDYMFSVARRHQFRFKVQEAEDVEILSQVGLNGVPCDAPVADLIAAKYICQRPAGHGAIREFAKYTLTLKKRACHSYNDFLDFLEFPSDKCAKICNTDSQ